MPREVIPRGDGVCRAEEELDSVIGSDKMDDVKGPQPPPPPPPAPPGCRDGLDKGAVFEIIASILGSVTFEPEGVDICGCSGNGAAVVETTKSVGACGEDEGAEEEGEDRDDDNAKEEKEEQEEEEDKDKDEVVPTVVPEWGP